jgi:hypothetical protein
VELSTFAATWCTAGTGGHRGGGEWRRAGPLRARGHRRAPGWR